jgi:hypothetical protein
MKPVSLTVTLEACPWQAEGRLDDGRWFYMRHRFCIASLGVGATLENAVKDSFTNEIEYHEDNADCGRRPGQGFCSGLIGEEIAYVWQLLACMHGEPVTS